MKRIRLVLIMLAAAMVITTAGAYACTGVYVGKKVSTDGTTIIARSEDQGESGYNKLFKVMPRITKAGRYMVDTGEDQNGFRVPLPETTYKYTYVPDSTASTAGMFPACCTNEYGVAVMGTVSAGHNSTYDLFDPYVDTGTGLREAIEPALIDCQCKTAREAVVVFGKLLKKYGSEEGSILMFADKKEAWIFEVYGGHQYCAMGNAEGSVFIPFFSGITATNKAYHVDGSAYNASSAYWTFKKNTALEMTDRAFLEQGVRDYWKIQEKLQYSQIQSELAKVQAAYKNGRTEGRSYVTALGNKMAAAQLSNANALYNDLFYTFTANLNDRANNLRKTTFVGNTKMTPAAKLMGYKVSSSTKTVDKQKVKTYTLTKGDKKVVFSMGTGVYSVTEGTAAAVEGTFTNLPYVSGGYVYVPVDFINSL